MTIDPVCAFHGKRWSEHEGGRCLFCSICFNALTVETCWEDEHGQKWDLCQRCGEMEEKVMKALGVDKPI